MQINNPIIMERIIGKSKSIENTKYLGCIRFIDNKNSSIGIKRWTVIILTTYAGKSKNFSSMVNMGPSSSAKALVKLAEIKNKLLIAPHIPPTIAPNFSHLSINCTISPILK